MVDRVLGGEVNAIYAGSTDANPERWMVTQAITNNHVGLARA